MRILMSVPKHVESTAVCDSVRCDSCNALIRDVGEYQDWDCYLNIREGNVWPEGDASKFASFDFCVKCFRDKILPFLKTIVKTEIGIDEDDSLTGATDYDEYGYEAMP